MSTATATATSTFFHAVPIEVPEALRRLSHQYGTRVVESYVRGDAEKQSSKDLSFELSGRPMIWKDVAAQMWGRMGEVAWAMHLGLDPLKDLDWKCENLDQGWDFAIGDLRVDVKTSIHPRAKYLMWHVNKTWPPRANYLAFARPSYALGNTMYLGGIISTERFWSDHKVAVPNDNTKLVAGTRYVEAFSSPCDPPDSVRVGRARK